MRDEVESRVVVEEREREILRPAREGQAPIDARECAIAILGAALVRAAGRGGRVVARVQAAIPGTVCARDGCRDRDTGRHPGAGRSHSMRGNP